MKKRTIFLATIAVFIATAVVLFSVKRNSIKTNSSSPTPSPTIKQIKINNANLTVTVADTEETRTKGLTNLNKLPQDQGMLFVFESKDVVPSFWMKGMKFPLDFIWIKNGEIVQIDANVAYPATDTLDNAVKVYIPNSPVDYVLEINAGFSGANNIKIGDKVYLSL